MKGFSSLQIIILVVIIIGIVAGVYLVQRTQIFSPQAQDQTVPQYPSLPEVPVELVTPPPTGTSNSTTSASPTP